MPSDISAGKPVEVGLGSQVSMPVTLYGKEKVYGSIP
jgi:hypothetical protein